MNPDDITVTSLSRSCIACPASWTGETADGKNFYARYRGGVFNVRVSDEEHPSIENEVYSASRGGPFEGHLTAYELVEWLREAGFGIEVSLPESFYNQPAEECELALFGTWIDELRCTECNWTLPSDELIQFEYEHVLPPHCLDCSQDFEVTTSTPEHIKELEEHSEK